jgi:hypothetical protein
MSKFTRYELYVVVSLGLGYISTLGETDYIASLSSSIIPWLIALFAVNTTITVQSISHLIRFRSFIEVGIQGVVGSMRNTCIKQVVILAIVYATILIIQYLMVLWNTGDAFLTILQNSIVTFSLLYYVASIFDNSMALYDLIITEDELIKGQDKKETKELKTNLNKK